LALAAVVLAVLLEPAAAFLFYRMLARASTSSMSGRIALAAAQGFDIPQLGTSPKIGKDYKGA